ncbi:MAG: hypothetical protein M3178_10640 [Pseudomonadota bacterium]|nr:hypothetical protein [Pseudomonadota bacterium]
MTAKLTDRERWQRDLSVMAAAAITTDALDDLVFSWILNRETELVVEVEAGIPMQDELDVIRALLRLIRMPLSRLQ